MVLKHALKARHMTIRCTNVYLSNVFEILATCTPKWNVSCTEEQNGYRLSIWLWCILNQVKTAGLSTGMTMFIFLHMTSMC